VRSSTRCSVRLGRVLRELGERPAARAVLESAATWYAAAGGGDDAALAEFLLAALTVDDSGPDTALLRVREVARREGPTEIELLALDRLAALRVDQGEPAEAEALLAEADRLVPAVQHLLGRHDRADADRARRLIAAARIADGG
jgi:predicted negative regulator of RcsB-dependent stress response